MSKKLFRNKHYNTPGHAHELTFSCYRRILFFNDKLACDRNLWNPKAIHDSIGYIEANPVRLKLISSPEEWLWSSARARKTGKGVVPDVYTMPVKLDNPQKQWVGIV